MVMVLTVVCVLMFLFILPWYCHGYGIDCGLCSDVSSSYCLGTVMVTVVTMVCVLMLLPHIAMVLSWLLY